MECFVALSFVLVLCGIVMVLWYCAVARCVFCLCVVSCRGVVLCIVVCFVLALRGLMCGVRFRCVVLRCFYYKKGVCVALCVVTCIVFRVLCCFRFILC